MSEIVKPKHLKRGDTVGLIAPSTPPFEPGQLEFTFKRLEQLGLNYTVGKHVYDSYGDIAGTDEDRAADFHAMWADPEVSAVIAVRGGTGSVRMLPKLDFDLIAKHPKILVGFSDITGLLIPIHQRTGLVTFHGPTAGSFFEDEYTFTHFVRALFEPQAIGKVEDPQALRGWRPKYPPPRMVLSPGVATGRLVGGCLTLVKQLMGTQFEIQTEGRILFLEDVKEEPHNIDRMLCQLLYAGKLQSAAAIVFGESVDCKPGASDRKVAALNGSLENVLRNRLGSLGIPVLYGLRFGHGEVKTTLPLGVMATVDTRDARNAEFTIEEAATS